MAKRETGVLLGFTDEFITEKHKGQLNFTTNKIGGLPDFPNGTKFTPPICPLCQLVRPLVVQIYAPLENSTFHRILYLFACINPNCWNSSESWLCLRIQTQEKVIDYMEDSLVLTSKTSATDWCADADDWNDDNANNEENGNVIKNPDKVSDEEEESCSLEDSIWSSFGNISFNDKNENDSKEAQGGAIGRLHSPAASAEIEGNEGEVISIDTPTFPQHDINALMQEVPSVPQEIFQLSSRSPSLIQFNSYFMSVWEETFEKYQENISDSHVKDLFQEYQQQNDDLTNLSSPENSTPNMDNYEKYEKSHPAHGDRMFHRFLSRIQVNPGQILRYGRESIPLLLQPIQDVSTRCQYCQGDMIFEFQLIPTIISKLKLVTDPKKYARFEFGTILVYTCRKSCWSTDALVRVETVILQTETY